MADYNWTDLNHGDIFGEGTLPGGFNPDSDVLIFDDAAFSAAQVLVDGNDTETFLSLNGKFITLNTAPLTVTGTNITFADGSMLIIGDNDTGTGGDDGPNVIIGGAGDDQLIGLGGADSLSGGAGNDLFPIFGDDTAYGDDTINGGSGGRDRVDFRDGDFGVVVDMGNETAHGSATGGDGDPGSTLTLIRVEAVSGTEQGDVFNANSDVLINGLRGDITQRFEGKGGDDTINGATGDGRNTSIEYFSAASGVHVDLGEGTADDGDGGTDTFTNIDGVYGSGNADTLIGGSDSASNTGTLLEFFEGMAGDDHIDGEGGDDEARYEFSPDGVVVDLGAGQAFDDGWGHTDTLVSIDRVRGSEFADELTGSSGNNQIEGLGGDDTIDGGSGGFDRARYGRATAAVAVNIGSLDIDLAEYGFDAEIIAAGTGESIGVGDDAEVGVDTLINIDGVRGTDFNDILIGGGNAAGFNDRQELDGWGGNDTLDGDIAPGALQLASFTRDLTGVIVNLSGADLEFGEEIIAAGTARDGYGVNGNPAGVDTLLDIDGARGSVFADVLVGGEGDEWFNGNDGDDYIHAGGGNDTIQGSEGRDTMLGGDGDDLFQGVTTQVTALVGEARPIFEGGLGDDTVIGGVGDGVITTVSYRNAGSGIVLNLATGIASDGEGGTDTFIIANNANVDGVIGSMFTDILWGGGNARSIGGGQNERFEGLAGHDTINGFSGTDQAMYIQSPGAVIVNLSAEEVVVGEETVASGTARDGWDAGDEGGLAGYTDVLQSISIVIGSEFNDTFFGGGSDEQFDGRGGDDVIDGGDGFDSVRFFQATAGVAVNLSDAEIDLADYGLETQLVAGGTSVGIAGDNGVGTDTFVNIEYARGSDYDDVLVGGGAGLVDESAGLYQGAEMFGGEAGNDTLDGGDADTSSFDIASYERGPSAVIVNLGATDIFYGDYTISGGQALDGYGVNGAEHGIDTLIDINGAEGSRHNDTLVGGDGDEVFQGNRGNDSIVGGAGIDTMTFLDAGTGVIVNMFGSSTITVNGVTVGALSARDGQGSGAGGTDTFSGIENAIGGDFNDFLQGNSSASNRLEGGWGNDILSGSGTQDTVSGQGNDTLLGGDGDDTLRQSRGNDSIDGGDQFSSDRLEFYVGGINYGTAAGQASVHVDLGQGFSNADRGNVDTVNGAGGDTANISGIEFVLGTAGSDLLVGGSLARASSDTFVETYQGNAGNDTIDGHGTSVHHGRGFNDQVQYNNSTSAVNVNLATGTASDGFGGTDKLIDINWVRGSSFNDVLTGSDNSSTGRMERFEGRAGSDIINGGAGTDEASYINSTNGVNVNLVTGIAHDGWGFTDALFNIERIRGSDHNDVLTGTNSTTVMERFSGEEGNDTINGGGGIDFASWSPTEVEEGGVNIYIENGFGTVDDGFGFTDTLQNIEGLEGSSSGDTLAGGGGSQWFRGRGGSDVLNGGANADWADYSQDRLGVIVNLGVTQVVANVGDGAETVAGGTARDGFGGISDLGGTDTLVSIENVFGSTLNDHITGGTGVNLLDGNTGNDTLNGGGGNDTLVGNAGNDVLDGGAGNDTLDGSAGNDVIRGGSEDDVFIDKVGADTLYGGTGDDTFFADYAAGTITTDGEAGSDTWVLNPNATGSTIRVLNFDNSGIGVNRDYIDVGALLDASAVEGFYTGQDPFASGFLKFSNVLGNKILEWDKTGGGNQYVEVLTLVGLGAQNVTSASFKGFVQGSNVANTLGGSTGNDVMLGLGGNDKLTGGNGNDQLFGGDGVDTLSGGLGSDVYEVDSLADKIIGESAAALVLPGGSDAGNDGLSSIGDTVIAAVNYTLATLNFVEHLQLTGTATRGTGNNLANHLAGNAGNDTLIGSGGNDTLNGGVGGDSLDGGTGNDLYIYDNNLDKAKEAAGTTGGTDTVHSSATLTKLLDANVEHLVLLGAGNISGRGNNLHNTLTGNAGKNTLDGDAGNDTLNGGAGNDTLKGGLGNDLYLIDAPGDIVTELANGGTDTVQSTVTESLSANVENLVLLGNLDIDGTGNILANRITGNANENVLDGGDGSDTLEGGTGNDTLNGGTGADVDRLVGGDGNDVYIIDLTTDVVVEASGPNAGNHDAVLSSATYTLNGNVEDLVLTGVAAINGTGNTLNNEIIGNGAVNRLDGGAGNDTVDGGLGADTLKGGAGFDSLLWGEGDVLVDGGADYDRLYVTGGGITIDLTGVESGVLVGVEEINLTGSGDNTLVLTATDILDIAPTANFLIVNGDDGDSVDAGGGWAQQDDNTLADGITYQVYTQGAATLYVSHALDLTITLE